MFDMFGYNCVVASLLIDSEVKALTSLLETSGLTFEDGADYTALIEDPDGGLVGSASLFGNVIRMVVVAPAHRDAGLSAVAISNLMEIARPKGIFHLFIYTKPDMAQNFKTLGFRLIAETDSVSLLETGEPGIDEYRKYLEQNRFEAGPSRIGAVIVNCSPFTLGHRYIIEKASQFCDFLYVIVVETDLSFFSFAERFAMVSAGVQELKNVRVLKSSDYAVSASTFPTYFLKDRADAAQAEEQAKLDLELFVGLFVPELGINVRFIGTEKDCATTAIYNRAMLELLPPLGVEVCEVERKETSAGDVISASKVRKKIKARDMDDIAEYLPASTIEFLREKKYI